MPDIFINNHEPPFPIRANRLLDSTGIRVNLHPPLNSPPPWIMKKIKYVLNLPSVKATKIILQIITNSVHWNIFRAKALIRQYTQMDPNLQ